MDIFTDSLPTAILIDPSRAPRSLVATPLLLRPPHRFEALTGHRVGERNLETNPIRIPGGAAALVDESIAEVLLSLVRLKVFG